MFFPDPENTEVAALCCMDYFLQLPQFAFGGTKRLESWFRGTMTQALTDSWFKSTHKHALEWPGQSPNLNRESVARLDPVLTDTFPPFWVSLSKFTKVNGQKCIWMCKSSIDMPERILQL